MDPAVIAHRGYAGVVPENTVAAAAFAAAQPETTAIEIDVQPAACGTPVVIHDERLEGSEERGRPLTDGTGQVWETPLEDLRSTRVLGTEETVPTLAEVLEAIPETIGVNVELKNPGTTNLHAGESLDAEERTARRAVWQPFVDQVVADCADFGGELVFSSFCEGAIAALREAAPGYAAAALVWEDLEAGLEVARRYDCEAIHPPKNAIVGGGLEGTVYAGIDLGEPDVDVVQAAHEEGRTVNAWTVETWVEADQLLAAGVDGLITEYPALLEWP